MHKDRAANTARETDAFSRQARRFIVFARGELKKHKRALAKRARKSAKQGLRSKD